MLVPRPEYELSKLRKRSFIFYYLGLENRNKIYGHFGKDTEIF